MRGIREAVRGVVLAALCCAIIASTVACRDDSGPIRPIAGGDPARGATLIKAFGCGTCHDIPGIDGAVGLVGPPLVHFARHSYIAGELPNTGDNLIRWIRSPRAVEPGTAMPDLGVGESDARNMAAYLYTLR